MTSIQRMGLSLLLSLVAVSTSGAGVLVSIHDGRVTIVATNASTGEILAEWARVGRTNVVNLEQLPRDRVTLDLRDVSEVQALRVLLRQISGYVAAPRAAADPALSSFDRILLMPAARRPLDQQPAAVRTAAGAPADPNLVSAYQPSPNEGQTVPADADAVAPIVVPDEPAPVPLFMTAGSGTVDPRASISNKARQALETVDPRKFNFKTPPTAGRTAPTAPETGALGSSSQPVPQSRKVGGQ